MPHLRVETSVKESEIKDPQVVAVALSTALSQATGTPQRYYAVSLLPGINIAFGDPAESSSPAAVCTLFAIGHDAVNAEKNAKNSKVISDILEEHLRVPPERCYVLFRQVDSQDWGVKGSTVKIVFNM